MAGVVFLILERGDEFFVGMRLLDEFFERFLAYFWLSCAYIVCEQLLLIGRQRVW